MPEAILSADISGKPLGGRDYAPNPAEELTALFTPPAGEEGVAAPPLPPLLAFGPSVLPPFNEKSWSHSCLPKPRLCICHSGLLCTAFVPIIHLNILPRHAMLSLGVRPSVTFVYCIQTAEDIVELLSRPGYSSIILVF